MIESLYHDCRIKRLAVLGVVALSQLAIGQDAVTLFRLQRSMAELNIESGAQHARGMYGMTYGNPGDLWRYPNSSLCLVVYNDGRYVLEKRDEHTVGNPHVKSAVGSLGADELQQLRTILDDEALRTLTTPKAPDLPEDTQAIREMETLDLRIKRDVQDQRFATVKERVKTMSRSLSAGLSNGMDTYLDNGAPYKKTLNPLIKWFEALEKRTKSSLKDAKPQYCMPMNIG